MQPFERLALVVGTTVVGLTVMAATASAGVLATRTCHGLPVTISASTGEVHGTPRADVIALTGAAHVEAGAGNDIICGSPKADVIAAGPGDDVVVGAGGADHLYGGAGRDRLYGDRGADHLEGGPGADYLMGGRGHDTVVRAGSATPGHDQQQFGDVVAPGARSISLVVDPASVQSMYVNGTSFGTIMGDATTPGALPVVWNSFQPMMINMISLDAQLAVYASGAPALMPGVTIQPTSTVNAWPGQTFNVVTMGTPQLQVAGSGMAGVVSVTNLGDDPAMVGLARPTLVNGQSGAPSPMTASPLWGQMLTQMRVPTQATLFFNTQQATSGQVISALTRGTNVLAAQSSPGEDTATVSFNINTGFKQD